MTTKNDTAALAAVAQPSGLVYCRYCRCPKPAAGFKVVRDKKGLVRNRKCADCRKMKLKSAAERDAIGRRIGDERRAAESRSAKWIEEARRRGELYDRLNDPAPVGRPKKRSKA